MIKVLYVWSDQASEFNCSYHRVYVPVYGLRRAGIPVEMCYIDHWINHEPEAVRKAEWADLIVLQRNLFGPAFLAVTEWVAKGKKVVLDLDDSYEFMSHGTGSPSAEFWLDGLVLQADGTKARIAPLPFDSLRWGAKICGAVSSPSKVICGDWQKYANTYFVPNYYDPKAYARRAVSKEPGVVYIGWGGSAGHVMSFNNSGAGDAITQIVKEFKQVKVIIIGDARIQKSILKTMSPSRRVPLDFVPNAIWPKLLSYMDIGIVPLNGEYDRRRSFLKSMEYTEMGIPWVGTEMEPNQFIESGRLVKNTVKDWYEALKEYITHLADYKAEIAKNQVLARAWQIDENIDNLMQTWQRALEGK
jgi:predicted protein tyrosine phosphatase